MYMVDNMKESHKIVGVQIEIILTAHEIMVSSYIY